MWTQPSCSNFFHFHAFFGKILPNNRSAPSLLGLAPPPPSGIPYCSYMTTILLVSEEAFVASPRLAILEFYIMCPSPGVLELLLSRYESVGVLKVNNKNRCRVIFHFFSMVLRVTLLTEFLLLPRVCLSRSVTP